MCLNRKKSKIFSSGKLSFDCLVVTDECIAIPSLWTLNLGEIY